MDRQVKEVERRVKIEEWMASSWKRARDSNARFLNIGDYNLAVFVHDNLWKYRIRKDGMEPIWSTERLWSEQGAKRGVCEAFADLVGL